MSLRKSALAFVSGKRGKFRSQFGRRVATTVVVAAIFIAASASWVVAQQRATAALDGMTQAEISATIGKDQAAYHFVAKGNSFGAENARNSLSADFGAGGVNFRSGSNHWNLSLRGYGYGDNLVAVKPATPNANANRLQYPREGLTEWYVNGPAGLEQGFTLASAPPKTNGQPLTLALTLSGNLRASVDEEGRGLMLKRDGYVVLRYGGLVATDSSGRDLRAWMEVAGNELRFRVDDRGAQYPVTIDPIVQAVELTNNQGGCIIEESAITVHANTGCAEGEANDQFGYSVAISSDGSTVAVLAPNAVTGTATPGAAYVFVRPAKGWGLCIQVGCYNYIARLTSNDFFGTPSTVVMSSDESTIVILEAPADQVSPSSAYVYVEPSTGWADATETARIDADETDVSPPCCNLSALPSSVGVSGDGSTIVLAYTGGQGTGTSPGQAYVYVRPSTGWATTKNANATLTATDAGDGSWFGESVAISSDGSTIAVGAPLGFGSALFGGAIYVYTQPSTGWANATQTAKLTSAAATEDLELGETVAIDAGGRTIVSLPRAEGFGSAYVFTEPSTTTCISGSRFCFFFFNWTDTTETAQLSTSDGAGLNFPSDALTISGDGSTIIGSNQGVGQGTAYVYIKPFNGWASGTETTKVTSSDSAAALFGNALATDNNGTLTVIGARLTTVGSISEEGSAYLFSGSAASSVASVSPTSLSFGQQVVGTTSAAQTVTVTNTGTANLNVTGVAASAQFTVASDNCVTSSPIAPGASCTDTVAFAPTALGPATGTWTITDDNGGVAGSTQQVQLSGTGIVATTTTAISSLLNPSTYGQAVTFTAVVTNASRTPTGTVTFTDGANVLGAVGLTGGTASLTTTTLAAGSHSIIASYSGDTTNSFNPSTSPALAQTVNLATSTTVVTSSVNPSYLNQTVTYTATITSQYGGAVSGNVMFKQGATTLATVPLPLGTTQVSYSTSYATAGTYNITAVYSGDVNNIGSTSAVLKQSVKALPIATTTVVASSGSPSLINQPVTFTATISSTDGVPDNVTVTFYDGATALGTVTSASGVAVFGPVSSLTAKTHTIKATYAGDATYKTSTGSVTQVVNLYPTTTTATATPNSIAFGQAVELTATVTSSAPGGPTGTVKFAAGTTSLGSAPLSGTTATLSTMKIPAGTTAITATYVSDGISAASSGTTPISVAQATTTTSVVSSKNPSTAGQSVKFTATVSSATTIPTGAVTFMDGATTLGTANLSGGKASYTTTALTSGTHDITVVYGGTANIVGSTSTALVQTVN